ncbi:hypothetical protein E3O45_02025 [Cryobacterium sp. TMS1-20-1]|uniref:hypothetical protein n=1 Tax=Cryobacterium sp. TMS1-20-1 TaxID=1259223 RepID=UPI00106D619F|nr:hypothetical protein [Cryobacterium sp. TMS1-20-1]TFC80532.1 hypothetical protein E3O45_02025 [Cryobacterium sp. TMS1-20-1]
MSVVDKLPGRSSRSARTRERALRSDIPPMDGAWTPNEDLDGPPALWSGPGPVDVLPLGDGAAVVVGDSRLETVVAADPASRRLLIDLETTVTAACAFGDDIALATTGGILLVTQTGVLRQGPRLPDATFGHVTALASDPSGSLWVAVGSSVRTTEEWQTDLLIRGRTGSVLRIDPGASDAVLVADGLEWPSGLLPDDSGCIVSEAWAHRLIRVDDHGRTVLQDDLPGYPGQLSAVPGGGAWLSLFAPRSALVDFVMKEERYKEEMIRTLEARAWVAPQLRTLHHPVEQVQGGELLVFGQMKPWAPTRSYGLIARLDENGRALYSHHSRANGSRHGIVRSVEDGDRLWVVSRGSGEVFSLDRTGPELGEGQ